MTDLGALLVQADARHLPLRDESVQCVVTSPPYWGLRDYGAVGQMGLEATPEEYVERMVCVFREVRRVLCPDGTLWLNLGDSYAGSWGAQGRPQGATGQMHGRSVTSARQISEHPQFLTRTGARGIGGSLGLKPKDLVMMPFEVARALRIDGWYVRAEIVWHKPNQMPESVTDRPTRSHESLFLLTRSERYFYDADAIVEPMSESTAKRLAQASLDTQVGGSKTDAYQANHPGRKQRDRRPTDVLRHMRDNPTLGRNKRDVWTIPTKPYPGAHFATFPEALVEPCIRAGSAAGDVVLDPFNGSGTTGRVALRLGRSYVGADISREYLAEQAVRRLDGVQMEAAL